MKAWFYLDKQNARKQVLEEELPSLANGGEVTPKTNMWSEGMPNWKPAAEVLPELFNGGQVGASPPPVPAGAVAGPIPGQRCHEVDYEIFGDDMQIVEVELDPGEIVIAEAGAMNYLEADISFEAKMGDGSRPNDGVMGKLLAVGKRALTGESIFMTHFRHTGGSGKRRVAFAAPYPGKIIPLNLADIGNEITCQKDAFLCAAFGTEVTIAFNRRLGAGFFGGEGFILQRLKGDGMAFVHAGGTVIKRELKGEKLRVDTGCLVAFSPGISYDIERAGNLKSMFFGGEGLFLATLQGHGIVYLQSLPFSRMADRILAHAPSSGGKSKGEGSVLGGIGRLLDGD
ncbi:TIGR00266 family protein [soil metagenome]